MTEANKTRSPKPATEERAFGEWDPTVPSLDWEEEVRAQESNGYVLIVGHDEWPDREVVKKRFIEAFRKHHVLLRDAPWTAANDPEASEIDGLRKELNEIRLRLKRVEEITQGVDAPASVDPDLAWCLEHKELLQEFPNSFVAIDTKQGKVLVSDVNQNGFIEKLKQLEPEIRKQLLRIHTSQFSQSSGV